MYHFFIGASFQAVNELAKHDTHLKLCQAREIFQEFRMLVQFFKTTVFQDNNASYNSRQKNEKSIQSHVKKNLPLTCL